MVQSSAGISKNWERNSDFGLSLGNVLTILLDALLVPCRVKVKLACESQHTTQTQH